MASQSKSKMDEAVCKFCEGPGPLIVVVLASAGAAFLSVKIVNKLFPDTPKKV
jgi:hypothetical protein